MNDDLNQRIQELEKQLRKRTLLFTGVLTAIVVLLGSVMIERMTSPAHVSVYPDVIESERIRGTMGSMRTSENHTRFVLDEIVWLEDKSGFTSRPRAQLVADDEQTGLLLYDRSGQVRVRLVVSGDQPKLVFLDKDREAVYSAP